MSPAHSDRPSKKRDREETALIPLRYQHPAAIVVIILALVIFFGPALFSNKTFVSGDSIASHSFDTYLKDARQDGIFPLWNPYIFCGMPGYGSLTVTGDRWFDFSFMTLNKVQNLFGVILVNFPVAIVLFYYIILGLGVYVLSFSKTASKVAALVASLGTVFSVFIIIWIMVSHNTKIVAISMVPWIFFILERLREKFAWWQALTLVLLFHFLFGSTHVQMIYYSGFAVGLYLVIELGIAAVRRMDWKPVLRTAAVAAVAAVVAFGMDADRYLSVLEYNPYSIRGSGPLVPSTQSASTPSVSSGGLDYEYATNWSLGPGELMTFLVPTWYGFGWLTYSGPLVSQPFRFGGYWGPQPWTDASQYMGIVMLVLAVLGFVRYRREPFVIFLGVLIGISLLVSFGKEWPYVYDLLFKYAPGFNKFRVPSMILVLVQLAVPLLAGFGIKGIFETASDGASPKMILRWQRAALALGVILLLTLVVRGVFEDFYKGFFPVQEVGPRLARVLGTADGRVISAFYQFIVDTVMTDVTVALVLLLSVVGATYLYWQRSIRTTLFAGVIIVAGLSDLWRIDLRSFDPQPAANNQAIFAEPDFVRAIKTDSSMYRVLTFQNGQPPFDNTLAYWRVQSAYGYQGAKMRAYQDVVDIAGLDNPLVWQLMNVKYIISNTPDSSVFLEKVFTGASNAVYKFRGALPRTFFVQRFVVAPPAQVLNEMTNRTFNPLDVAFVDKEPGIAIDPPGAEANATVEKFGIHDLTIRARATGNNLLFLSETWYPVGWKAFIDGQETQILRLNYLFRGVVVPKGDHTIEMRFEPTGFVLGKNISLGTNIAVLAGLLYLGIQSWLMRRRKAGMVN